MVLSAAIDQIRGRETLARQLRKRVRATGLDLRILWEFWTQILKYAIRSWINQHRSKPLDRLHRGRRRIGEPTIRDIRHGFSKRRLGIVAGTNIHVEERTALGGGSVNGESRN